MSHSVRIKDLTPRQQENVRGGWLGRVLGGIINPRVGTAIGGGVGGKATDDNEAAS